MNLLVLDLEDAREETVKFAVNSSKEALDIVINNLPDTLMDCELAVRTLYHWARPCNQKDWGLDVTVFPKRVMHRNWTTVLVPAGSNGPEWLHVQEVVHCPSTEGPNLASVLASLDKNQKETKRFNVVAVGGTFDHFHLGHKLLLTLTGFVTRNTMIVGVTGPKLLKNKQYPEFLEPFEKRVKSLSTFIHRIYPDLKIEPYEIDDVYGPTAFIENIEALVVSKETRKGGDQINEFRRKKSWNELEIVEIGLVESTVDDDPKLSSTYLRKMEYEASR